MVHTSALFTLYTLSFLLFIASIQVFSQEGVGFELPCSILFGLAHIETRGLKQVYDTVFGLCFGESFDFNS